MLKVGITGHRYLDNSKVFIYKKKIFCELIRLKEKYPSMALYSSLADGADRIAVREAIKLNIEFIAVLPMPVKIYALDFDISSRNELYVLLDQSKETITLPLINKHSLECISEHGDQRNLQYEQAGRYIANKSDILFALWDGTFNNLKGGTGEIVKYSKKLKKKLFHIKVERDML